MSQLTTKYMEGMGKLKVLSGVLASNQMNWESKQHRKNREAEEAAARQQWGSDGNQEGDDMGDQTILGDVIMNSPNEQKQESGGLAKTAAALGLAAAGLGAGTALPIAAWNLTRPSADTEEVHGTDNDTKYGLKIYRDPEGQ